MLSLSERTILKANRELLELHKRCIVTYLTQKAIKHNKQKKFFIIYDHYINEKNIRMFFHRPIKMFVYALITDRLDQIKDYFPCTATK